MDNEKLKEQIKKLEERIDKLEGRRIVPSDIFPGAVKNRALGEANSYIYCGQSADLPTKGFQNGISTSVYFELDTGKLQIWTGTEWVEIALA